MSALQEQFVSEARELIRQATDDLIALERDGVSADRIDGVFRAFHTLKGSAGVVDLPAMSMMLHAAEDLLASLRRGSLAMDARIVDAALACLDQVSRWVDQFEAAGALPLQAGDDGRVMAARLRSLLRGDAVLQPPPVSMAGGSGKTLPEWVLRLLATEREALPSRMPQPPSAATAIGYEPIAGCFYNGDDPLQLMRQIPDLLTLRIEPRQPFLPLAAFDPYACNLRLQAISAGDSEKIAGIFRLVPDQVQIISIPWEALSGDGPDRLTATTASTVERTVDRVLRVSEANIENLVNLVGELVVARNALAYSARQVEQALGGGEVVRSIQRDRDAIDRLVSELHGTVLQLRMVPMAQLFGSFPRLVRDVARRLNKNVALATQGETTEVDKSILDRLFEPMLHLVRNALDHGVEDPGQRRASGKSEVATISIAATRVADRLMVEVTDDGRGIDPAEVRRKAFEQRIVSPEDLTALTDEAVVDLVFAAGFSTASTVSDISGRGIGMDVVRTAMEQIGGRVSIESKVGLGTTVRLDLPMTIAMSRIMVVEAGGQSFGIAMDAVTETVRVTPDQVSTIKNNDGFVRRERIVPIVSLAELMKLPARKRDVTAPRLLVVIEATGRIAAFEIDAIRDRLDGVLKPMQGLLAGARGYAGTTLMGDGRVLLVLDMKAMLP